MLAPSKPKSSLRGFSFPARRQAVLAESSELDMPLIVYSRKYLPTKTRAYCVTNKEQHDLAKKFPQKDVEKGLADLSDFLLGNQHLLPSSASKAKELILWWFSGASATR